ncbi:MAG: alpha/beta hydrolase family protein [Balneolaceae bacterium]
MSFSSVAKKSGQINSTENLPIYYDLYTPVGGNKSAFPIILFIHGFKGFKDWGPFPDACEELSRAGFAVVAFNLSLNGVGESMTEFDQLDLFERQTLSQDLKDVGSVIDAIKNKEIMSDKVILDSDRIGILGHSRGGHTAVASAAEYSDIHCLVTWSAVANYNERWTKEMISDWKKKGYTEILNARTGQVMRVGKVVYDDAIKNAERLIAVNRVKELHIPCLFIAGKDDESVPFSDTELLHKNCPSVEKEIRLLTGTGHTFDASHPFEEQDFPKKFNEVLGFTEGWFLEYLG